jgi:hypothetical protein
MTSNCPNPLSLCVCVCVCRYDYHKQRLDNPILWETTLNQGSPDSIVPMGRPALETSLCAHEPTGQQLHRPQYSEIKGLKCLNSHVFLFFMKPVRATRRLHLCDEEILDVSNAKKCRANVTITSRNKLLLQKLTVRQPDTFCVFVLVITI